MKNIFKNIGRIFVILTHEEEKILKRSVLIVDNGYSPYEHLRSAVRQTQDRVPGSQISVLTLEHRRRFLQENFPDIKMLHPDRHIKPKKYQLAIQMFKLRKKGYNFVVLMSLDKTPIIVSLLFMKSHILLYNRWNEWYLLRFRNIWEYIILRRGADKDKLKSKRNAFVKLVLFIPLLIAHLVTFIYLLVSAVFIFSRKTYYALKFKIGKGD